MIPFCTIFIRLLNYYHEKIVLHILIGPSYKIVQRRQQEKSIPMQRLAFESTSKCRHMLGLGVKSLYIDKSRDR
jgi:hypothetical protein